MRKRLFLVLAVVCIAAVFAGVFAGCNNGDGNGGGGSTGAGDKIFTEGATLEDILTALENAESLTYWYTQEGEYSDGPEGEVYESKGVYDYKLTQDAIYLSADYRENEYEYIHNIYYYRSEGVDLTVTLLDGSEGASESAVKERAELDPERYSDMLYDMGAGKLADYLTTDAGGNIVIDAAKMDEGYVQGSGYVRLNGNSIEIGYDFDYSYEENGVDRGSLTLIWSGVNATTVDIPAEVRALEAEAEWADSVYYNGVSYEKETDENGEEYYFVRHAEEDAVIEETINTLPVRER